MPRPVAFRPEMLRTVVDALLAGSTYRAACEAAGIPWRTWCDWSKAHRDGGHPDPDVDGLVSAARVAYGNATNGILLWRVALQGLANAGFERDVRAVVAANGGVASPMLPVDELVSAVEAPRVLAAALVQEWANDAEDHTDAEKELRALLDAPLAVEAPAPSVGCVDCGDAAALLRPGETVVCVCGKKHTRPAAVETVRVWIAESEWDALDGGMQSYLGEIEYDGPARAVIEWEGTQGFVFATVPTGPVLDELRTTLRQNDIPFFEGAERPTPEPPKPSKKPRTSKKTAKAAAAPVATAMTEADRAAFERDLNAAHASPRVDPSVPEHLRDLAQHAAQACDGAWWVVVAAGTPTLSDRVDVSRCPDLDTARSLRDRKLVDDAGSHNLRRVAVFSPEGAVVDELTWTRVTSTSPTLGKYPDAKLFRVAAPIGDAHADAQEWARSRGLCWYSKSVERLTPAEALAGDAWLHWGRQNSDAVTIVPRDLVLFVERRAAAPRDDGSVRAELRIEPWTVEAMQGHCALRDDGVVLGLDEREWRVLHLAPDKVLLSIDEDTVGEAAVEVLSPRLDGTSRWWGAVKQPKKSGAKTSRAKKGGAK